MLNIFCAEGDFRACLASGEQFDWLNPVTLVHLEHAQSELSALHFAVTETRDDVVVDHPRGLHERVADG
jgi:hypothetical protein